MNPDGRLMQRFERQLQQRVQAAFGNMRTALFEGLDDNSAMSALQRLDSQAVIIPFRDSIIRGLQEIAIAGAEFGREQVERHVFGVKAIDPEDGRPLSLSLAIDWQLANNAVAECTMF